MSACGHGVPLIFYCRQCDTFEAREADRRQREGDTYDKAAHELVSKWQKLHCDSCKPSSIEALTANIAELLRTWGQ